MSKHKQSFTNLKAEMDKYEVIKLLGEGSFGRVYKAKVISDGSFVALKVISKGRRPNKEIVGLRRECEIQRHLHHPNIIQMLDSFETSSEIVVVTEFAQKELNMILGREGYLSEERAGPIIWDLVSALNYLHSHRVLHRDLKPQNILIDLKNHAKLCDFGFARNMSTGTHVLTSIKGTPLYMAPELIEEQPYDYKADLWSLGCIMYEMLVGAPPFCSASILHLIRLIRHEQIQWPTFVSESCVSFLKGLLQKDPVRRINWQAILSHGFIRGHILICDDLTNMPLTKAMSSNTLQAKEQQRKDYLSNKSGNASTKPSPPHSGTPQDVKNNNLATSDNNSSCSKPGSKLNFIEDTHPIETEEWIVFLQKTMEEVISGEMTSLTQPYLTNIIVLPLRNANTSPRVLTYAAKLLSIPFAMPPAVSLGTLESIKKAYLEVKLVPNLVYSSKQIMRLKPDGGTPSSSGPHQQDTFIKVADLTDEDVHCLEHIYMLIAYLTHWDHEFLSQLCDSIVVLNVYLVFRAFFNCKSGQIVADVLAVITNILRVFPENVDLIERIIIVGEELENVNLVELLRHNESIVKERTCFFVFSLGKYLQSDRMELLWNEAVRETLEALMYDSIESVRNAAERVVDALKLREFYKR